MQFTAQQIAGLIGGTIEGDATAIVTKLSKIEEGVPQSLSFLSNPQYSPYLYQTKASVIIVSNDQVLEKPVNATLIRVADPRASFAVLLEAYNQIRNNKTGIEQPSFLAPSARLGENIYIGAFTNIGEHVKIGNNVKIHSGCVIGDNVEIADNTVLFAGVKVYTDCVIGKDCRIHSGVVIGGDGFGFAPNSDNNYKKVPQIGNVVIGDHVEIGSNTTIDRATLGSTVIRKGVKLDNLIQVAHNVDIGENTVIAAQTGISGSTRIGKNCMIGGQVGIVGHLTIGDNVKIAAQSGIGQNLEDGAMVQGSPAFTVGNYKRSYVMFRNLPEIGLKMKELEKMFREMTEK